MALAKDGVLLANKFRGCLVGALLGDCLGSPYEGDDHISKVVLQKYFDKLEGPYFPSPLKQYTDDTAMTNSVAESLIANNGLNEKDLAQRFVNRFFKSPRRGYGQNVVDIFYKLKSQKEENVFQPAREQFGGLGSYGNGGAMRVAPVALYCMNNFNSMLHVATQTTLVTHSNVLGVNGALLQCIAVYLALNTDPKTPFDIQNFTKELQSEISKVENRCELYEDYNNEAAGGFPYEKKFKSLIELLQREEKGLRIPDEEVDTLLGTSVAALHSVPTAIYCFLRAHKEIPNIETSNGFRRTIQYAISLGGDTDTIASMAGAIAGSYYGFSEINKNLQKHCEAVDNAVRLADQLYELVSSS